VSHHRSFLSGECLEEPEAGSVPEAVFTPKNTKHWRSTSPCQRNSTELSRLAPRDLPRQRGLASFEFLIKAPQRDQRAAVPFFVLNPHKTNALKILLKLLKGQFPRDKMFTQDF
jgi:hypothetical protein